MVPNDQACFAQKRLNHWFSVENRRHCCSPIFKHISAAATRGRNTPALANETWGTLGFSEEPSTAGNGEIRQNQEPPSILQQHRSRSNDQKALPAVLRLVLWLAPPEPWQAKSASVLMASGVAMDFARQEQRDSEEPFMRNVIPKEEELNGKRRSRALLPFLLLSSNYLPFCLCQGGQASKRLVWKAVNRIYANLMSPAITGGSDLLGFFFASGKMFSTASLQPH